MLEAGGCAQCNRDSGGHAPCTALYAGGRGGELCLLEAVEGELFAGGARGDAPCATANVVEKGDKPLQKWQQKPQDVELPR